VHHSVEAVFTQHLIKAIEDFYASESVRDYHYGKLVNEKSFRRLQQYLAEGNVAYGGSYDEATLFFAPTLLTNILPNAKVMQDEIFGPLLPIISWRTEEEALNIIAQNNNPLAFYVFTGSAKKADWWIKKLPFGGGCINNCSWHLTNHELPFGGRGNSGIGAYHGKFSFRTFSHQKAILKTPVWFDPAIKYPPFTGRLNLFKKFIR
jgi:aldehyde dehydrogenase (NAD+)